MSTDRLNSLRAENDQAGREMMTEAGRFAALADRDSNGLAARPVVAFNLFQTPDGIAWRMAQMIPENLITCRRVLEPSAGLGRLFKHVRARVDCAKFTLVEQSPDCMKELYNLTSCMSATLKQGDFLEMDDLGKFDIIIMNPPFKMGRDVKHINHALEMLSPCGILISLCYNGVKQNKNLKPMCDSWEVLPAGAFKSEGTQAEIALLTIKKERTA